MRGNDGINSHCAALVSILYIHALLFTASATAIEVFVGPDGVDSTNCGQSSGTPCATLSYAVNTVGSGSSYVVVMMLRGAYNASSCGNVVSTPLNVVGAGANITTIDCTGSMARFLLTSTTVDLSNIHITNAFMDDGVGGGAVAVVVDHSSRVVGTSFGAGVQDTQLSVSLSGVIIDNCYVVIQSNDDSPALLGGGGAVSVQVLQTNMSINVAVTDSVLSGNSAISAGEGTWMLWIARLLRSRCGLWSLSPSHRSDSPWAAVGGAMVVYVTSAQKISVQLRNVQVVGNWAEGTLTIVTPATSWRDTALSCVVRCSWTA